MFVWHLSSQEIYDKIQALSPEKQTELFEKLKNEYIKQVARERPLFERIKVALFRVWLWMLLMGMALGATIDGLLSLISLTWTDSRPLVAAVVFIRRRFTKTPISWKDRRDAIRGNVRQIISQVYALNNYKYMAWRDAISEKLYKEQKDAFEDVARRFIVD